MSEAAKTYTFTASCHCGAVKFLAKDIDPAACIKCNCTFCTKTGMVSLKVKPNTIVLLVQKKSESGDEEVEEQVVMSVTNGHAVADAHPTLTYYAQNPERYTVGEKESYHYFCNKCGVLAFMLAFFKAWGGDFDFINMRCLDLKSVPDAQFDFKELTIPEKTIYINGRDNSFQRRTGEPWDDGIW